MSITRFVAPLAATALLSAVPGTARAAAANPAIAARVARYEASYAHAMTPAFARQTGLACNVCHTHYPELTAAGRAFKLNGYVLRRSDSLSGTNPQGTQNLLLNLVPPLAFMVQTSYTQTAKAVPGTANGSLLLPDQLSLFTGGEITPHVGSFIQLTMDPNEGSFGVDNVDFRFANSTTFLHQNTVYGLSLNNNPTVQDLWNSTPAWGFPYGSTSVAPTPGAATMIDGSLGGAVAGLTAYTMWNNRVYLEAGAYRSAPWGSARPITLDNSAAGLVAGWAPYWRVALPFDLGVHSVSVGAYGMSANRYSSDATQQNKFTDVAFDLTWMLPVGSNSFTLDGTYINETQNWTDTTAAANRKNTLHTVRADAMYHVGHMWALTVAPFSTTGTADATLYPADAISGSATGSPNSSGVIGEVDYMPWQNLRLQLQYVAYSKFNGGSTNYDGAGRNAAHNNTLYFLTWILF